MRSAASRLIGSTHPARRTSVASTMLRIAVLVLLSTTLPTRAGALPPGTQPPTPQETNVWNQKIARLQANAASMPTGVADALASLSGVVSKSFPCPEGSTVASVTVNITTTLVKWDSNLAAADSAGTYYWNASSAIADGAKTVTADNWVMLDPEVTVPDEADPPLGPLADETLAYHELLHAQLLITEMDTAAWQQKACNCQFDDEASDEDHSEIYPATDGYIENRAPAVDTSVVRPPAQTADGDGNFDIELGATTKTTWKFDILEPSAGSNVDIDSIDVTVVDGKFHVTGKLLDKTKKGKFFIRIDPPDVWVFGGIENALVVLPAAAVPTLSLWGLAALTALLLAGAAALIRRRHRPRAA